MEREREEHAKSKHLKTEQYNNKVITLWLQLGDGDFFMTRSSNYEANGSNRRSI